MPEINIGLVGHVDHGKTSLTQALTGKWTDTHSEEIKRGISIRLGYADATFYFCKKCNSYSSSNKCNKCFDDSEASRSVSFVDAPGHETLMATMLSGAYLMDGAVLVIAADEKCPQPQTAEHLKALDVVGIKNIVIVQNKIDIVSEQQAIDNFKQIKAFIKGTVAENAPIIPISAVHNTNIDVLIEAIEKYIPTPTRSEGSSRFYIARSFDINKPGTPIAELKGGVIGGSLTHGSLKVNDEIEIEPGARQGDVWKPIKTKIVEIIQSGQLLEKAEPGGLVALQTKIDPALSRSDGMAGNIAGQSLPQTLNIIKMSLELFNYVIGTEGKQQITGLKISDSLLLTVGIAKTVGIVTSVKKSKTKESMIEAKLKIPVIAEKGERVAISKQVGGRWHLIGHGVIM